MNSPAYATVTAAIQATLRRGYNTFVARVTRWPLVPLPIEPEDPSQMHLAINFNFEQGHEVVFMVVMLIHLAPSPRSSVRAKVSLILSPTFQ